MNLEGHSFVEAKILYFLNLITSYLCRCIYRDNE